MKLTKIKLVNFRNYSNISISFSDRLNILIGDNAQGKTNVLEAIVFLALTKSHRVVTNANVIKLGKQKAIVQGFVKKDKLMSKLEIELFEKEKLVKVNNDEVKRISDYISNLNIIVFTPDDLEIIKGSPNIRRGLLNIQLSQVSKVYLNTYNEYNKILKTRNEYLKVLFNNSIADRKYLDIITDKLIEKAIIIYEKRRDYIAEINKKINEYYKEISDFSGLKVCYLPNISFTSYDRDSMKKEMEDIYKNNYLKELNYGMTIYGPHRDDFSFIYNDMDMKIYSSQGQQKMAVMAFKLSEINIFESYSSTSPILLLDDIFGELDVKKRNKLLKLINSKQIQSILTTTDLRNINKKYLVDASIYEVKNGCVERK